MAYHLSFLGYSVERRLNGLISYAQKEKGIANQPTSEERSTYFTFSEIQISPREEMEVNSLFLIIKAKLPARVLHQKRKKLNVIFVMHRVKIYLDSILFFFSFYQGIVRTVKMSFYKWKI